MSIKFVPLTSGFLALAVGACQSSPVAVSEQESPPIAFAKGGNGNGGGGPPSGSSTSLDVEFDDGMGGLASDGGGMYSDGVDDVRAIIADDDNFSFDASTKKKSATRLVDVVITTPDSVSSRGLVDLIGQSKDLCPANQFAGCQPGEVDAALGAMAVGDTLPLIITFRWVEGSTEHRLKYGLGCASNVDRIPSKRATAIRTATEWQIFGSDATWCTYPTHGNAPPVTVSADAVADFSLSLTPRP